jgi:hypothetical protein
MKLYEMPNTVVYLKTQEEYDEYMKMCEEVGWKWDNDLLPTQHNIFNEYPDVCVYIKEKLIFCDKAYYEDQEYNILSFSELLNKLEGCGTKTCLEFRELHPYLIYALLENGAKPELIDGEISCIFHTDDFLIRIVGETDNFEVQFGVRETFDRWANSVDFTFSLAVSKEDTYETIVNYIDSRIAKINALYREIPTDFFYDPCLKISV